MSDHILVIEDSPLVQKLLAVCLRDLGLPLEGALDGPSGLEAACARPPALVILDIGLPGMDGIQFCKLLRSMPEYRDIPVIHCTVHTDFQTRTQSALSGGDDFISKPVLPMELALKAVMHLIERQGLA